LCGEGGLRIFSRSIGCAPRFCAQKGKFVTTHGLDQRDSALTELLGIAEGGFDTVDPVGLGRSLAKVAVGTARHPTALARASARFLGGLMEASAAATARLVGAAAGGPVGVEPKDRRFEDATWSENGLYFGLLQSYLLADRLVMEMVEGAQLNEPAASKARFAARLLVDAMAPTNQLLGNPTALRRAFETGGLSLVRGARHFLEDVASNGGWPRQVDTSPFTLGDNMAATKGRVVYRNELIELIQYEPQTPQVHALPMLLCPPWINKYYIMDLAPGKSLVEWSVQHGLTTFAISYRNPDSSMRDLSFDDYVIEGPRAAIDAIISITGAPKVNTLAVCLGGTLQAVMLAYMNAQGEDLVNSSTYLNALTDFHDAGTLKSVFTDERTVESLAKRMEAKGYLEAADMAHTFDLLRARDLVFKYVASNWLMGEDPPAFDMLAWNSDSTRMPAKMHAYYLRRCWIDNALAKDEMECNGVRLMTSEISNDTYIVAAVDDHIVPWRSSYRTTQLFKGECRFVLSSSGHIAGIVNPPNPKSKLWTNDSLPPSPDAWLAKATEHRETWWNDWINWVIPRSGALVPPPPLGHPDEEPDVKAPGTYVYG
jgi:polyhydroxyalkanoate synthase